MWILAAVLILATLPGPAGSEGPDGISPNDFVILQTDGEGPARVVAGSPALADQAFCPASTFKILLAWVALERGVVATSTRITCQDPHLGTGTYALDLHQGLLHSSNRFFLEVAPRLGRPALDEFLVRSGYASSSALVGWLSRKWTPVVKGGKLRISPRRQHSFIERLMKGGIPGPAAIRAQLVEALRWPSSDPSLALFGKTGAAGGVLWFTGFGERGGEWRAVTVFARGPVSRRPAVIAAFYRRFGLSWDPALLPPLR